MNKRIIPKPQRPVNPLPKTKEQFMIEWVLLRAAFRESFSGTAAALEASDTWDTIQRNK